ncbi:pyridoxal phosphate-dependent transferase [Entophlyctis helioformis]|nr:pyridoxal phosphate-dependent transferase [Entophlyctis helioformis]
MDVKLRKLLDERTRKGLLRTLALPGTTTTTAQPGAQPPVLIDFSSNDYLGLSTTGVLESRLSILNDAAFAPASASASASHDLQRHPRIGSTGSRLLAGNSAAALDLERRLSTHYAAESALLFNSGYDANLSLFSALPQRSDLVLYDELIHASVHDGMRLRRFGKAASFRHNDVADVRSKVAAFLAAADGGGEGGSDGCVIVAVEAVYSMDGDTAPLVELAALAREHPGRVNLIVDEAHSTGIYGQAGVGLVAHLGVQDAVFARLHTFGKAMGVHGAVVVGSRTLTQFLTNYGRPLIYSTMMPFHSLQAIRASHDEVAERWSELQDSMSANIQLFRRLMQDLPAGATLLESHTPIQGVVLPGNERATRLARLLVERGLGVLPIRFPSVPRGTERLRICIHVHNSQAEIAVLARECIAAIRAVLDATPLAAPLPSARL